MIGLFLVIFWDRRLIDVVPSLMAGILFLLHRRRIVAVKDLRQQRIRVFGRLCICLAGVAHQTH